MNKIIVDWPSRGHGYLESEMESIVNILSDDKNVDSGSKCIKI